MDKIIERVATGIVVVFCLGAFGALLYELYLLDQGFGCL